MVPWYVWFLFMCVVLGLRLRALRYQKDVVPRTAVPFIQVSHSAFCHHCLYPVQQSRESSTSSLTHSVFLSSPIQIQHTYTKFEIARLRDPYHRCKQPDKLQPPMHKHGHDVSTGVPTADHPHEGRGGAPLITPMEGGAAGWQRGSVVAAHSTSSSRARPSRASSRPPPGFEARTSLSY